MVHGVLEEMGPREGPVEAFWRPRGGPAEDDRPLGRRSRRIYEAGGASTASRMRPITSFR